MGNQIIRQPDGMFAVFSSVTDTIHIYNATAQEIEDYFVERAAEDMRRRVQEILTHVAAGEAKRAYFQFAMTWEEAVAMDKLRGGDFATEVTDG